MMEMSKCQSENDAARSESDGHLLSVLWALAAADALLSLCEHLCGGHVRGVRQSCGQTNSHTGCLGEIWTECESIMKDGLPSLTAKIRMVCEQKEDIQLGRG